MKILSISILTVVMSLGYLTANASALPQSPNQVSTQDFICIGAICQADE